MDHGVLLHNNLPNDISLAMFKANQRNGVADDLRISNEQFRSRLLATMALSAPNEFNPSIAGHKVREP